MIKNILDTPLFFSKQTLFIKIYLMEVNGQLETTCKNHMSKLQIVVNTSCDFVIVVSNQCVDKPSILFSNYADTMGLHLMSHWLLKNSH